MDVPGVGWVGVAGGLWPGIGTEREDLESAMRSGSQWQHEDRLVVWEGILRGPGRGPSNIPFTSPRPVSPPALCAGHRFQLRRFLLRSKGLSDVVAVAATQASAPSP